MINRDIIDGQEAITLNLGENSITIIKTLGGMVYSVNLKNNDILFHDKKHELTKNDLFRGRLLFPFNDRIPEGRYSFEGRDLQFPLNCDGKDSIHGLIYNRAMEEMGCNESEDEVTIKLKAEIKKGEFPGYPFDIELTVDYILTKDDFVMQFNIKNPGITNSPFAFGWHPYFTFGNNINSSRLTFAADEYYDVDEDLYYKGDHYTVKGTELDFTNGLIIGEKELDIAISLSNNAEFLLEDNNKKLEVTFSKSLFPALQLFIPDDRLSIAVEPISAPSDTFNYPDTGLKVLKPGEYIEGFVKLTLSGN